MSFPSMSIFSSLQRGDRSQDKNDATVRLSSEHVGQGHGRAEKELAPLSMGWAQRTEPKMVFGCSSGLNESELGRVLESQFALTELM